MGLRVEDVPLGPSAESCSLGIPTQLQCFRFGRKSETPFPASDSVGTSKPICDRKLGRVSEPSSVPSLVILWLGIWLTAESVCPMGEDRSHREWV